MGAPPLPGNIGHPGEPSASGVCWSPGRIELAASPKKHNQCVGQPTTLRCRLGPASSEPLHTIILEGSRPSGRSRSNSASPPNTIKIKRPCYVVSDMIIR
jgi:hypothetical protein